MHTFQPYPMDLIEFNPFAKIGDEWMLITAKDGDKINAMTASWGGVGVLWGKNTAFIFVRDSRYTKELIDKGSYFSLTFFESSYKSALKYFGMVSGRTEDKIRNAKMNVGYFEEIPYIDEGNFVICCRKMSAVPIRPEHFLDAGIESQWYPDGNLHTMYVGEIVQILAR
ncbi:MAG: flavin reductase family protein [Eubacterium sp.]|jgi:flavin reductase (DIM6/NTAB) family NADH-FMN oxidoreductase RutF|nr:flavin reductase family protein [Eubacterium sp.]